MRELQERFPEGLKYAIVYDTTPFIHESVDEVFKTLVDAVILVAIVVLLFLQDWKAVMLPLIDVGVSLVGTFAVMRLMGFTLNNLTLFGLVLAIGIVVDDAIVVLENIERWLAKGLQRPRRDHQGDGRDHRADHRHHAGAQRGVPAQRVPRRHHRPVLPPVRADDRGVDDHLGRQRHDDDAGPGRRDLRGPQARRTAMATTAARRCRGGSSACVGGLLSLLAALAAGRRRGSAWPTAARAQSATPAACG